MILSMIISPLIMSFFYFCFNIGNIRRWYHDFSYIELIIAFICTFGAAIINYEYINLGLMVGMYFSCYLASNKNKIAFLYSILTFFILRYMFESLYTDLLLIASGLYYVNSIFTSFIFLLYFIICYYLNILPIDVIVVCLGVLVFFEICRMFVVKKNDDEYLIMNMYENNRNKVNREVEMFAEFLDNLSKDYCNKDYYKELNDCIISLGRIHCEQCYMKKDC